MFLGYRHRLTQSCRAGYILRNFAEQPGGCMTRPRSRLNGTVRQVTAGLFALAVTALLLAPAATASPESDAGDAISAAWDASGGDGGPLGGRNGDVYAVGSGFGQNFASGKIFFTPATGAHYVTGAILEKYDALGG